MLWCIYNDVNCNIYAFMPIYTTPVTVNEPLCSLSRVKGFAEHRRPNYRYIRRGRDVYNWRVFSLEAHVLEPLFPISLPTPWEVSAPSCTEEHHFCRPQDLHLHLRLRQNTNWAFCRTEESRGRNRRTGRTNAAAWPDQTRKVSPRAILFSWARRTEARERHVPCPSLSRRLPTWRAWSSWGGHASSLELRTSRLGSAPSGRWWTSSVPGAWRCSPTWTRTWNTYIR